MKHLTFVLLLLITPVALVYCLAVGLLRLPAVAYIKACGNLLVEYS